LGILTGRTFFEGHTVRSVSPLNSPQTNCKPDPFESGCQRIAELEQMAFSLFDKLHPGKHATYGLSRKPVGNHPAKAALLFTRHPASQTKNKHIHQTN
jgi:hypothetical protein